jgi:hypothetical protein
MSHRARIAIPPKIPSDASVCARENGAPLKRSQAVKDTPESGWVFFRVEVPHATSFFIGTRALTAQPEDRT